MNCILYSPDCILIIILIEFCQTDNYFTKRLLIHSPDIHDEQIGNYVLNIDSSNLNSPSIHQCPMKCFIENDSQNMVNCISEEADTKSARLNIIPCERNVETGELVLGQKESIRGIVPGALGHLLQSTSLTTGKPLSRSGQLELHINLNMVRLDARSFQGLGGSITNIRLLNTVYMHPDSLIDLQHLRSFEIESGRTPLYLSDDYPNNKIKEPTIQTNKPTFIRLNPLDNTIPISFNLNAKCHQCPQVNDSRVSNSNDMSDRTQTKTDNLIIIVFTNKRDLSMSQDKFIKLNMIFPYTCPIIIDGIGCSRQTDIITMKNDDSSELNAIVSKQSLLESKPESSLLNISVIEQLKTMTFIHTESKHTLSLSIILIIWCTIITIGFIIIIIIILYCIRRRFIKIPSSTKVTQITPFRLFHVCGQQNPSIDGDEVNGNEDVDEEGEIEEISSNSVSSGFFSQQPKTCVTGEKSELLSITNDNTTSYIEITKNNRYSMHDKRSSWSTLCSANNPLKNASTLQCRCSVVSLKDSKSANYNKYGAIYSMLQSNKYNSHRYTDKHNNHYIYRRPYLSKRRSIGSQTDFTNIESDNPEIYCTLDRFIMQKYRRYATNNDTTDGFSSKRTTSNQIFPYFQNNKLNQMDGIVITKSNIYSNNLFSHSNITMNDNSSCMTSNVDNTTSYRNRNNTSIVEKSNNNNTDTFILMIDDKSRSKHNLPRLNSISKFSNSLNKQIEHMKDEWNGHKIPNGSVTHSGD
ncbi:hypothetical protein MN116_001348 [Schistosoma mekongi]|uniref:Uncharacterized protein n=1 Tax=Schistosoma mekongi TaxID=38744 RepID=A0AAE1ZMB8_SCHME|nr:hypothetical protein MN116_001348 [Schistosoma mekongi]